MQGRPGRRDHAVRPRRTASTRRADLELAEELARRAALAIDNARLYRARAGGAAGARRVPVDRRPRDPRAGHRASIWPCSRCDGASCRREARAGSWRIVEREDRRLGAVRRRVAGPRARSATGRLALRARTVDLGRGRARRRDAARVRRSSAADHRWSLRERARVVGKWDRFASSRSSSTSCRTRSSSALGKPIEITVGARGGRRAPGGRGSRNRDRARGLPRSSSRSSARCRCVTMAAWASACTSSRRSSTPWAGSISVESEVGKGSMFTVELPQTTVTPRI